METKLRKSILKNSFLAGACHLGSALSCVEILLAIDRVKRQDDIFIFSKASGVAAYYCLLAEKGIISRGKIVYYLKNYPLASKQVPGVIHSVGSISHGINVSTGIAFANKKKKVYCLTSDGEMNEGSTWEAALFSGHHKLSNLILLCDVNKLQACGFTRDILNLEPLKEKFEAFGWSVMRIDGHNLSVMSYALKNWKSNKPKIMLCDTIKGKGVSFLGNKMESHYMNLTKKQLDKALSEL